MKFRTILLGLAALFVAINAAYFSVLGLSKLFAGASTSVIVMASSLELAKLITAGFLYNYWDNINKILRSYLMVGVFVLIVITSAGIYGFLTSAYQKTSDQLGMLDKRIELVETKKDRYQIQYNEYSVEKTQLQQTITELSKGLSNNVIQYKDKETGQIITTTSSNTRKVLTTQLNENKEQRDKISVKMEILSDSITSLDIKALEIRATDEVAGEVGPLKYLGNITGLPMDKIVNWFALFIIFVFDPLAVTLIVAFNVALKVDKGIVDKNEVIRKRRIYGEEDDDWDGFFDEPKSDEEKEKIRKAKEEGDKIVKKVEDTKAWERFFDEDGEPNETLKNAFKKFQQKKHIVEIIEEDEKSGIYENEDEISKETQDFIDDDSEFSKDTELFTFGNADEYEDEKRMNIIGQNGNDGEHYENEAANEPVNEPVNEAANWDELEDSNLDTPLTQDDIIKDIEVEEETINNIELVDEEIIVPEDLNKDGIITPDEQRIYYETTGWKNAYQNKPFYHHPWFNWDIAERWINDSHAVEFWKRYRGGNQAQLDAYSKYPTDFSKKTY